MTFTAYSEYAKTLTFCGPFVFPMVCLRVIGVIGLIAFIVLNVALWWNVKVKL